MTKTTNPMLICPACKADLQMAVNAMWCTNWFCGVRTQAMVA